MKSSPTLCRMRVRYSPGDFTRTSISRWAMGNVTRFKEWRQSVNLQITISAVGWQLFAVQFCDWVCLNASAEIGQEVEDLFLAQNVHKTFGHWRKGRWFDLFDIGARHFFLCPRDTI